MTNEQKETQKEIARDQLENIPCISEIEFDVEYDDKYTAYCQITFTGGDKTHFADWRQYMSFTAGMLRMKVEQNLHLLSIGATK